MPSTTYRFTDSRRAVGALTVVLATLGMTSIASLGVTSPAAAADVTRANGGAAEPTATPIALPTVAASFDPLSGAAANALSALWFGSPTYLAELDEVVAHVAFRGHISPTLLRHIWENTDKNRMIVVLSALTQVGVRYRHYMAEEGKGFDCSGLTAWAWSKVGVALPHYSYKQLMLSTRVDAGVARPGDLLYYPGHVMMAVGVGTAMVHAPYTGANVEVRALPLRTNGRVLAASPIG